MPNPKDFKDQKSFMNECMHQTLKVEGKPRAQSIGQCLGMWRDRNKKKKKGKKKTASDILRMIAAKIGVTYKSNSVQLPLPKDLAKEIIAWGRKNISDEDIFKEDPEKGFENEIHATVLYGIEEEIPEVVEEIIKDKAIKPFNVTLGNISIFNNNPDYDVIKIDGSSPELIQLNALLRENLSYENKFSVYQIHHTIAYVKKGSANSILGCSEFNGIKYKVNVIQFSGVSGKKYNIKFNSI